MRSYIPSDARLIPDQANCVFRGKIYDVYQWQQQMFDGSFETFEMLKRPDTVKALAIKDDSLVVLEQEQPGSKLFFDLPGGRHDVASETELEAVKREMLEETGLTFGSWKLIEVTQPFSKIDWFVYLFLATDYESITTQNLDAGEKISIHYQTLDELKSLLDSPKARYLPKELLESVHSLEALTQLPDLIGSTK